MKQPCFLGTVGTGDTQIAGNMKKFVSIVWLVMGGLEKDVCVREKSGSAGSFARKGDDV